MTYDELKRIQLQQLRIMDDIHRICAKHGYRYYLIGGSALGAVRHGGFIPWDVDIDIAMPRKDYNSFVAAANEYLSSDFELHYYMTDKDYRIPHAIVAMKRSELKLTCGNEINNKYGIYVDVLPLDQLPKNDQCKEKQIKSLRRIKKLRKLYDGDEYIENPLWKRILKRIVKICMHCVCTSHSLNKEQDRIISEYHTGDEGEYWCSMLSHYSLKKLTMPKEYFGNPTLMNFEGRKYFVPEKITLYLQQLFNDYQRYPSLEQRQKQMDLFSYASWINENGNKEEIEKNV